MVVVVGGLCAKSFSCKTRLRLCYVEVELSCGWGVDKTVPKRAVKGNFSRMFINKF